jgi:hypothetical protein
MVVFALWLDLQLPVESVPITYTVVSSNPAQAKCTIHKRDRLFKFKGSHACFIPEIELFSHEAIFILFPFFFYT